MTFRFQKTLNAVAVAALLTVSACSGGAKQEDGATAASEAPKTEFNIGWSIYAGWMPWPYAEKSGILGHGLHHPFQTMFEDVFEELPWHLEEQAEQAIRERRIKWPDWKE